MSLLQRTFLTGVIAVSFAATSPAMAQKPKPVDDRPISQNRSNLGNDKCDQQVRAKFPSGTLSTKSPLQMVESCRRGNSF